MLKSAIDVIVGIVFGVFLGYIVDHEFQTKPMMMIVFGVLGYVSAMYNLYRKNKGKDA